MIELNRSKQNKWILQKNISSSDLVETFVEAMKKQNDIINHDYMKQQLQENDTYQGRSIEGSASTMGVRLSQICFYMFGYRKDEKFFPSPMANLLSDENSELTKSEVFLICLFSLQYPHPYSRTSENFRIYFGRLIIKLLLDERLNEKLYIDECIYFLMFLETIDESIYEELVNSILEYRNLNFNQKERLFMSVEDYDEVFANATHEMNYYFIRLFSEYVFDIVEDKTHNGGNLFKFKHGNPHNGNYTIRTDAFASRENSSGYIQLNNDIKEDAKILIDNFSPFELPISEAEMLSKDEWIREIYQFNPLEYIDAISKTDDGATYVIQIVKNMVHNSKYGSRDGKSFEESLIPIFENFRENRNVEWISGSGNTDLLCAMDKNDDEIYNVNVDAKTAKTSTSSINPVRINNHINKCGSEYCIIVSPKFSSGVKGDIKNFNIVTIEAETLADYCLKESLSSTDKMADFTSLDEIIKNNLGTDITKRVNFLINDKFDMDG